mgnify:CR=1 FL=1
MKACSYMSVGQFYKSVEVEIDSSSESDISFAKSVLSSILKIKEQPKIINLQIDGTEVAQAVKDAIDSALSDDES